jgi:ankyrin repeat protein
LDNLDILSFLIGLHSSMIIFLALLLVLDVTYVCYHNSSLLDADPNSEEIAGNLVPDDGDADSALLLLIRRHAAGIYTHIPCDLTVQDDAGDSVLHLLIRRQHAAGVGLLLQAATKNGDSNLFLELLRTVNTRGNSILHEAASCENVEIVRELVRMSALFGISLDFPQLNIDGKTPIDLCVAPACRRALKPKTNIGGGVR